MISREEAKQLFDSLAFDMFTTIDEAEFIEYTFMTMDKRLDFMGKLKQYINQPTLSSDVEETIEYIKASVDDMFYGDNGLKPHIQEKFNTIRTALSDKDKEIEETESELQIALGIIVEKSAKLNAIEEVVENDILISMINEEDIHYSDISAIQQILKGDEVK